MTTLEVHSLWAVTGPDATRLYLTRRRAREVQRELGGTVYHITPYGPTSIDTGDGSIRHPAWRDLDAVQIVY